MGWAGGFRIVPETSPSAQLEGHHQVTGYKDSTPENKISMESFQRHSPPSPVGPY